MCYPYGGLAFASLEAKVPSSSSTVPYTFGLSSFRCFYGSGKEPDGNTLILPRNPCLADYIDNWLSCGDGVTACSGDFQIFLATVAVIIADWHRDPGILDYAGDPDEGEPEVVERRVSQAFNDSEYKHHIFDPYYFKTMVYTWS